MPVNLNKPKNWKSDIAQSVDQYNDWFLKFAPRTFRVEREKATEGVEAMLQRTDYLRKLSTAELKASPGILFALRMSTAPPIARDRLVGLADVPKSLVDAMEKKLLLPPRMASSSLDSHLSAMIKMINRLIDTDIFPWLGSRAAPSEAQVHRAATIVADRLCGANADPIIRNAQERRQLKKIKAWLEARGYGDYSQRTSFPLVHPGTFAFAQDVEVARQDFRPVSTTINSVIRPWVSAAKWTYLFLDFYSVTKPSRWLPLTLASKLGCLRRRYGNSFRYVLLLSGYCTPDLLGFLAAEGIDWTWDHRLSDLAHLGL